MILTAPLNSSLIQSKAAAPSDAVTANFAQSVSSKPSIFSKALAAATAAKRPERAKNAGATDASALNLAGQPIAVALPAVGANTIAVANPPNATEPTTTGDDSPDDLAVVALSGAGNAAGQVPAGSAEPALSSFAANSQTNAQINIPANTLANSPANSSASSASSADSFGSSVIGRTVGAATTLAAELRPSIPAHTAGAPGGAGTNSSDGKFPARPLAAVKAGSPFDSVNSLPARIANPVALKNATSSLESFAALAAPHASRTVTAAANNFDERIEGNAKSTLLGQRDASPQNPAAASVAGSSTDANALLNTQNQRVISDARQTLVGQLESKLQSEVSAPTPQPANGVGAIDGKNAAPGQSSQQGGTPSNSQGGAGKKGSDSPTDDSSDGDNSAVPVTGAELAAAIKSAATSAATAVSAAHGAEGAGGTFGAALATTVQGSVPSSGGASVATAEKPVLPQQQALPLPFAEAARPADAVKASEIYQRVDGSEMHVAMQTELLGAVDLRATIHQSGLTATISVQRSDVQSLLSSELPALQHALSDRNLHVEQISILNNSVHERAGGSGTAPQQQNPNGGKAPANSGASQPLRSAEALREELSASSPADAAQMGGAGYGRISIHA